MYLNCTILSREGKRETNVAVKIMIEDWVFAKKTLVSHLAESRKRTENRGNRLPELQNVTDPADISV